MALNYLAEILAFEQWLETHHLPILPQLLWYKMLYLCNRSGWSEWVTVDNLRLMAATQMSREATLIKARDELIKAGLIEYQKGKKGSPNRYRMISIAEKNTFKSVVQNAAESEAKEAVQPAPCSRHIRPRDGQKPFSGMPHRIPQTIQWGLPDISLFYFVFVYICLRFLLLLLLLMGDSHITEKDLVAAAANYAEAVRILGRAEDYIRSPESFFADNFFAGYLPGQYVRPKAGTKKGQGKNSFNQFAQNEYDFAALEDELVSN